MKDSRQKFSIFQIIPIFFSSEIQSFLSNLRCELNVIRELNLQLPSKLVQIPLLNNQSHINFIFFKCIDDKDELEKQAFIFFQNASTLSFEKRDSTFQSLLSKYEHILEVADKKINIIQWLENMLSDCLENLDREINKVKVELEIDNPGITTTIQEKVLNNARITSNKITQYELRKVKKFELK